MGYPEAQYVIDELKQNINIPVWINDYKIWGERSYVFNIPEMLDVIYLSREGINDTEINTEGIEYAINKGGTAFNTWLYGVESTKDQADSLFNGILTLDDLLSNSNAFSSIMNDPVISNAILNSSVIMSSIVSNTNAVSTIASSADLLKTFIDNEIFLDNLFKNTEAMNNLLGSTDTISMLTTNKTFMDAISKNDEYSTAFGSLDNISAFLALGTSDSVTYTGSVSETTALPELDNTYYFIKQVYAYMTASNQIGGGSVNIKTNLSASAMSESYSLGKGGNHTWPINKFCKTAKFSSSISYNSQNNRERVEYVKFVL